MINKFLSEQNYYELLEQWELVCQSFDICHVGNLLILCVSKIIHILDRFKQKCDIQF